MVLRLSTFCVCIGLKGLSTFLMVGIASLTWAWWFFETVFSNLRTSQWTMELMDGNFSKSMNEKFFIPYELNGHKLQDKLSALSFSIKCRLNSFEE